MLSRSECFKTLGLENDAGPNAIKRAYRKLAFELHPDLNPDTPDAARSFQRLNEAYVLLIQEYANTSFAASGRPGGAESGKSAEKTRAEAQKAYEKARAEAGGAGRSKNDSAGGPGRPKTAGAKTAEPRTGARAASREEILRDLLSDPFARRVFEDIYSHVRHNAGKTQTPPPRKPAARATGVPAANHSPAAGVSDKILRLAGGVKSWLRKRIDEEQTMCIPGASLMPGSRIRLQVSHGFSGDKKTVVEITLPPEFAPGRPIRLKGLGRRLGNMQGDLYLRIFIAEEDAK